MTNRYKGQDLPGFFNTEHFGHQVEYVRRRARASRSEDPPRVWVSAELAAGRNDVVRKTSSHCRYSLTIEIHLMSFVQPEVALISAEANMIPGSQPNAAHPYRSLDRTYLILNVVCDMLDIHCGAATGDIGLILSFEGSTQLACPVL